MVDKTIIMRKLILIISVLYSLSAYSTSWGKWIEIYKDNYTIVEIQFKIYDNSCKINKKNKFRYKITGESNPVKKVFQWILIFKDCNNNLISSKQEIIIGGNDFDNGIIQTQDYTFIGKLETDFSRIKIEPIIYEINSAIKSKKFNSAKKYIGELETKTNDKTIITKLKDNFDKEVDRFYKEQLNKLNTENQTDINQGIVVCKSALDIIFDLQKKSYYSEKLIYLQNKLRLINEKKIKDDIKNAILNQNFNIAISLYNDNKYKYQLDTEKELLIKQLFKSAKNNLINKNYYEAREDYSDLYKLTLNEKYSNEVKKIDEIIKKIENKENIDKYNELYATAKINNDIYSWEKVYSFHSKNKELLNNKNNGTNELYELWYNKIKENYKKAKRQKRKKNLISSQNYYNNSVNLINDYYREKYSANNKIKHEKKILDSSKKLEKKINKLGTTKVNSIRADYLKRKQKRKTIRFGVSYNIASFSSNFLTNNGFDSISSSNDPFLSYMQITDLSYFNFNAFYGRFGLYFSDFKKINKELQFNSGIYIKAYKSLYLRMGYIYTNNEKKDFYVSIIENDKFPYFYNKDIPLYIGVSIISAVEFEVGYNLYTNTINLGIGFSLWKKHKRIEDSW